MSNDVKLPKQAFNLMVVATQHKVTEAIELCIVLKRQGKISGEGLASDHFFP